MAIRKKDGNLYVLEGPNPIVDQQVAWDPDGLVFHNFSWDDINFVNERQKPKKRRTQEEVVAHTPAVPSKSEVPKKTEPPEEPQPEKNEQTKLEDGREFDLPYIKYKVLCYCLPATIKTHVDKLYGESWQRIIYGKKFIFPCVMMESNDITLQFWTSDPRNQVLEQSIVYPFTYEVHNKGTDSYDRVPYDEYRWWKVSSRESKEGGWLVSCVPSQDQPDFSD